VTQPAGDGVQATTTQPDQGTAQPGQVPVQPEPVPAAPQQPTTTGTPSTAAVTVTSTTNPRVFDEKYVEQLRQEAAGHRTKASTLETQVTSLQEQLKKYEQFMPEQVKTLQSQVESLQTVATKTAQDAKDANLKYAVAVAAQLLGIVDPEAAVVMMDQSKLVWDGGTPKTDSVSAALTTLLEQKPYLKAAPAVPVIPNPGPTNPGAQHGTPPLTLADIKKMKPEEINARWAEVSAVMAQGKK